MSTMVASDSVFYSYQFGTYGSSGAVDGVPAGAVSRDSAPFRSSDVARPYSSRMRLREGRFAEGRPRWPRLAGPLQLSVPSHASTTPIAGSALMRISGFSFARNAVKYDYPLREALLSILPVVDELVVAVAPGDPDDDTRGLVESLGDPRIRVVDAVWDDARRQEIYADLTNVALEECTGDWCLYIQADEALHEDDLPGLRARCQELLDDRRVEGLLFDYLHFFGDYRHIQDGQGWYQKEIRLIRNGIGVRSVRDAQSFRYPDQRRITVASARARVFHYGWVRHPRFMQAKVREFWSHRKTLEEVEAEYGGREDFDYGPLGRLPRYEGTHPAVMAQRIGAMDWAGSLREEDPPELVRTQRHKDERIRYRVLTAFKRLTGVDLNHRNHGRVLNV